MSPCVSLTLNVTIGADYLYIIEVNATCENGTKIYSTNYSYDGSYQTVTLNDTINNTLCADQEITILIEASDTHTNRYIPKIPHRIDGEKVIFNQKTSIYPKNPLNFNSVATEKLKDRHTFTFKRTPLIPNYTASEENIQGIGEFIVNELNNIPDQWDLLAFNKLCDIKYTQLGKSWSLQDEPLMTKDEMEYFIEIAKGTGVKNIKWSGLTR